jgi:phytoene dehydrogenase-like protein
VSATAEVMGRVGLPAPVAELAARDWDVVVVGGGHNGLTAAAYLAAAGRSVLVLERSERLGGACTLEEPWPGYRASPCAYLLGLLDERVIGELRLRERGLEVYRADPNVWVPFADGSSFGVWRDPARTEADLAALGVSRRDREGFWAYERLFEDLRLKLRHGARDAWEDASPSRDELEELLGGEAHLSDVVFRASIAEVLEAHMTDPRLHDALCPSGVIGTWAGPRDEGTASVHLMHYQGDLGGAGASWGYVRGGMGMVSFLIADAAREAGAVLATGTPVAAITPGEGVALADGTAIRARTVVVNADPKVVLRTAGPHLPDAFRARLEAWDVRSPVVKLNAALHRLPAWTAAGGATFPARGAVDCTLGMDAMQDAFARCERGESAVAFAEVYVQTVHDPSPAPPGRHLMSVFAQYAPEGGPASERQLLDLLARFAPDVEDCVEHLELLGAPDIERRVGLTGGHIFQGDCRPAQLWEHRLAARTPVEGLYLCGAATHPGGSVIGLNGRNAARAVLADVLSVA